MYQTEHFLDRDRHQRRYAGDVTWNARKREARRFIGLHKFLDPDTWYSPGDFKPLKSKASKFAFNFYDALAIAPSNPNLSVTQFYEALVEQLGLDVEKSDWKTELVFDGQGKAVLNKDGTQKRKKYKLRRICSDSWKWFELFCDHRREMKERRETASESVPATPENVYKNEGGWNIGLSQMEKEIEGDFKGEKFDAMTTTVTPNIDESLASINTQTTESNNVPTIPEKLYQTDGGWNITQPHTGQGIESDFSPQKTETNPTAILKMDESLTSINTQTTESNETFKSSLLPSALCPLPFLDDVPTTTENLYELGVGWNIAQSQNIQGIEGDFSSRKIELTDDELQNCLKELRQVKKADDYWVLYEQNSQRVEEAWKLLNLPEQLRIQQICDEGVDPLSLWKEGDRCLLWHPFAQEKWGLATVKQVVRGACGFIYVLRDDGFGLHLGREKLNLIAPTDIELA